MKNHLHGIPFQKKISMRMNQKIEKSGKPHEGICYLKISNCKFNRNTPRRSFYGREYFLYENSCLREVFIFAFKDKFCVARCDYGKLSQNKKLGLGYFFSKKVDSPVTVSGKLYSY